MKIEDNNNYIEAYSQDTKAFAESFPVMILECDQCGEIIFASSRTRQFLDLNSIDASSSIYSLLSEDEKDKMNAALKSAFTGIQPVKEDFIFITKSGTELQFYAVIESKAGIARLIIIDISRISSVHKKMLETERRHKALVEHAIHQALHDSLTNLFNKEMFLTRLEVELMKGAKRRARGSRIAVTCIGLDGFKKINDIYGTRIGDNLLQQTAQRLQNAIRTDDIVARFDGDKFMILFTDIASSDDVPFILRKIFSAFNEPFEVENESIRGSVSIGISLYPDDSQDEASLIKNAEEAMYNAKERGRNSYQFFDRIMHDEMMRRSILEKDMIEAIKQDEFIAYYQPKVDRDVKIIGMESLIRWYCHRRKKYITPMDFIPIAEKNGRIVDIGNNILLQSCLQNKKWIDAGYTPLRISVNLSVYQFRQKNLISMIKDILKHASLEPQYLDLEITESGILENEGENISKLNELHDMGISITIDDFGTGYSSLSKLKELPISALKIDKKFVDSLPFDTKSITIARSIIDLAHNLEYSVVSEGIENIDQFEFLVHHNCDEYQGYYFSEPVSADEFEVMLKKGFCTPGIE